MKTVICDIDGVLADFILGFRKIANALYNKPVYNMQQNPTWAMPDLTKHQYNTIWRIVKDPWSEFWRNLEPVESAYTFNNIQAINETCKLYFVTDRPGASVFQDSIDWLEQHGIKKPEVRITQPRYSKGAFAKLLNANYAIDDKPSNIEDIFIHKPNCIAHLRKALYNKDSWDKYPVVSSCFEWTNIILKGDK